MRLHNLRLNIYAALAAVLVASSCIGLADPGLTFIRPGGISWTNSVTDGWNRVEWAPSISNGSPWYATWSNLVGLCGGSDQWVSVTAPRFLRVAHETNAFSSDSVIDIPTNEQRVPVVVNGYCRIANLEAGATYAIDWRDGTNWLRDWSTLGNIAVTDFSMSASIPYVYRISVLSTNIAVQTNLPSGMVYILSGAYLVGPTNHQVEQTVSGYFCDTYEVRESLWDEVAAWAATNGYSLPADPTTEGADYPVSDVSWYDAIAWLNARSEQAGLTPLYYTDAAFSNVFRSSAALTNLLTVYSAALTNTGYRLPTETEWERAARGFQAGMYFPWGGLSDADCSPSNANYRNSGNLAELTGGTKTPVGGYWQISQYLADLPESPGEGMPTNGWNSIGYVYTPNDYGLYDMAGNVSEWCWDWFQYRQTGFLDEPATNYTGPVSGTRRVIRGGDYGCDPAQLSVHRRAFASPFRRYANIGFRCVRIP